MIKEEGLVFVINDWDKYAVEEAVLLKEKYGGTVTVIALGPEEAEDALRRCFATGCDDGIRLTDEAFEGSDAATVARVLAQVIKDLKFDLIFTGAQAGDDGYGQVGPALAELLSLPHASLVTQIEILDGEARVHRELEGGMEEIDEIKFPAVLTIQTGINEPRYVSIMGVRKAARKELEVLDVGKVGLKREEVGGGGSKTSIKRLFPPPATKEIEILSSEPQEAVTRLTQILKEKGVLAL